MLNILFTFYTYTDGIHPVYSTPVVSISKMECGMQLLGGRDRGSTARETTSTGK
jgi:hypothetical protein